MRLDEARSVKRALLSGAVVARAGDRGGAFEVAGAFVGIVPSDRPDGYRLAVRLTEPVEDSEGYRTALREVAGEDVDVRYVGPVRALTERPPGKAQPYALTGLAPPRAEVNADLAVDTCVDPAPSGPGAEPFPDRGAEPPATAPPTYPRPEQLQQRVRPLVRGASVAHRDVTAGTLGAFVGVGDSDAVHLLSNNHVLANSDRGQPGDAVLQPGAGDGGIARDRVGELLLAVRLAPDTPNLVDAALAVVDPGVEVDPAAHDGPMSGVIDATDVTGQVAKIGRTTGHTLGRISAVEVDGVPVGYDSGVYTFDDQVEIEGVDGAFSAGGDSGSVIYTVDSRQGVGLLFAGSATGGPGGAGVTYANSLATVLAALDARLLP